MNFELLDIKQGSPEWISLRKTKITATDASIIMGASHWKTKSQLYKEKISEVDEPQFVNERMQRGIDLEPIARDLFNIRTGFDMKPCVAVTDFTMASLDGRDSSTGLILEIKCPGEKDHAIALKGKIPDHYFPQIQHQMHVCDQDEAYYFSFDGIDGEIVLVKRDHEYIQKMLIEEKKFYDCIVNRVPPEPDENDYIEREDDIWKDSAERWRFVVSSIRELEKEEELLRKELIFLSGESNTKGAGISLCNIKRKGNIEYSRIPELHGVDLEAYRKPSISTWRISQ